MANISRRNGGVLSPIEPQVIQGLSHSVNLGDSLLAEVQTEGDLHVGGSYTNARKRQVGLESPVGGRRMPNFISRGWVEC